MGNRLKSLLWSCFYICIVYCIAAYTGNWVLSTYIVPKAFTETFYNTIYAATFTDYSHVVPTCLHADGVTDDSVCITNFASLAPGGKNLYLPSFKPGSVTTPANYYVTSSVVLGNGQVGPSGGGITLTGATYNSVSGALSITYAGSTPTPVGAKTIIIFGSSSGFSALNGSGNNTPTQVNSSSCSLGTCTVNFTAIATGLTTTSFTGTTSSFISYSTYNGLRLACEGVGGQSRLGQYNYIAPCTITAPANATFPVIQANLMQGLEIDDLNIVCSGTNTQAGILVYGVWGGGGPNRNSITNCKSGILRYGVGNGNLTAGYSFDNYGLPDTAHWDGAQNYIQLPNIAGTHGFEFGSSVPGSASYINVERSSAVVLNGSCPAGQIAYMFRQGDSNKIEDGHVYGGSTACTGAWGSGSSYCAVYGWEYNPSTSFPQSIQIKSTDSNGNIVSNPGGASCATEFSNLGTTATSTSNPIYYHSIITPSTANGASLPPYASGSVNGSTVTAIPQLLTTSQAPVSIAGESLLNQTAALNYTVATIPTTYPQSSKLFRLDYYITVNYVPAATGTATIKFTMSQDPTGSPFSTPASSSIACSNGNQAQGSAVLSSYSAASPATISLVTTTTGTFTGGCGYTVQYYIEEIRMPGSY